jgi:UDP-N-acetyl-D-glucosamine dehydrogenase
VNPAADKRPLAALAERIESQTAVVGVIGLGYVGLPLARAFCDGYRVLGFDTDPARVGRLARGEGYLARVPSSAVREMRKRGFEATTQLERLAEVDAALICVPTPLTRARDPDLSFVVSAARAVAAVLRRGQLVVLESTTYPGTTRGVVLPILAATGLRPGRDFFLAFSPEREDPGNPVHTTVSIPKVVGGLDPDSHRLAAALYGRVIERVVPVSSAEVAEASKILENTYRAVNIALVNELKMLFDRMGIDIWEVIEAASTKPFGFQAFYPGPGLGGHCIPIDPFYLAWIAREHHFPTRFIELAGEINASMPRYVIQKVTEALNSRGKAVMGSKVLLLGVAYKRDVDDPRESPALELVDQLLDRGAEVSYNDPHVPHMPPTPKRPSLRLNSTELTPACLRAQDCLLITTDHTAYDWPRVVAHSSLVVDTRNATRLVTAGRERIVRA